MSSRRGWHSDVHKQAAGAGTLAPPKGTSGQVAEAFAAWQRRRGFLSLAELRARRAEDRAARLREKMDLKPVI